MSTKHYNANYLEDTGKLLKSLKDYSYKFFEDIKEGTILDLGCGTGSDVLRMSEILNSGIQLVGIDHDLAMIEKANKDTSNQKNVEFIQSEAHCIPFGEDYIAGIRTERMIQHLKDPHAAFREIYRVLKKDHKVVIVETDWDSLNIYNEHHHISKKIVDFLTTEKVNNGLAAKRINYYLNEHKFKDVKLQVFPFVLTSLEDANNYLWFEKIVEEVKEKKIINEDESKVFEHSLKWADINNLFICSINLVLATAIK